ncbi:MAG: endonuclease III domain-containing protein [Lentisphaeria bacterium]|nr:endonuclease III domain-containing protein [Lentisphaeria bacterium]
MTTRSLETLYGQLLAAYGPQGWWPLLDHRGANPTRSGALTGYHPGRYDYPRTAEQRFEICVGAILTQNTAWPNVEKALLALQRAGALSLPGLEALGEAELLTCIRPSGYYRAKARKLREWSRFCRLTGEATPSREALLGVWGIGPETADSIRLYAYGLPEMVVDTYTRRVLAGLGHLPRAAGYDEVKALCIRGLPPDAMVYQEFHALMVEHAKRFYRRGTPADPLRFGDA